MTIIEIVGDCVFWGGREQHILDVVRGLAKNGHKVITISRANKDIIEKFSSYGQHLVLPLRKITDFTSIRALAKVIKESHAEIIHTHSTLDTWIALLAVKLVGRGRVFLTRHIVTKVKTDLAHKWFYKSLAGLICPSQMVRNDFIEQAPWMDESKLKVVYNGVDIDKLTAKTGDEFRTELGLTAEDILVGYVGRIAEEKGIEYLIRAIAKVADSNRNIKVVIVGHGDNNYFEKLKQETVTLGINKSVNFYGFTNDVAKVMNGIDVLVLPCIWQEVFGLVLCEAMACGKVPITTVLGAQREIIEEGKTGYFIPTKDADALAHLLLKVCSNRNEMQLIGARAKQVVEHKFSLRSMVLNLEQVFSQRYN